MIDIGLRREPHPPMPIVIPSRSSATTSVSVVRLSAIRLLHERVPRPITLPRQVQLEREPLLEAVAALDVHRVDPVERLLGRPDHRGALLGDGLSNLERRVPELCPLDDLQ